MYHLIITENSFLIRHAPLTVTQFRLGMIEHYNDHVALGWNDRKQCYEFRLSKECPIRIADHKMRNRNLAAIRKIAYLVSVDMARTEIKYSKGVHGVAKPAPVPVQEMVKGLWVENRKSAI